MGWVRRTGTTGLVLLMSGAIADARAEEAPEKKHPWSNSTELSVVVTDGNSKTRTVGLKDTLGREWTRSQFQLKLDALRSEAADDPFVRVAPGVEWQPGEIPAIGQTETVHPPLEPDAERYFVEGRYDREISKRLRWNAGGSWERNEDAGIINRSIAFGGMGHLWKKKDDLEFSTAYGLSYTSREEDEPDPQKDDRFAGIRLSWSYKDRFGKAALVGNEFTSNMSLKDSSDYSLDMTTSLGVTLSDHLALKVSLQWLYEHEPALEEVDLLAFIELVDPDGIPGNGDEFFRTVSSGGSEIALGDTNIRKDSLDTIFRTSLVVNF